MMRLPERWVGRMRLPVIAAPMFLVSNPALVIACCRTGVIGTFPSLNQRSTGGFAAWLEEVESALSGRDAPFGVNLIVHKTNQRLHADLAEVVRHRVPLVITSLGAVPEVIDAVHSYGGLIFHDVISARHAEKAVRAGVDGLIPVTAGAGGHAGTINPFALVADIRAMFDGYVALSGCIGNGRGIAAARALGADFAYMGSRFIATAEANAPPAFKQMVLDSGSSDVIYTPAISSIPGNFLRPSLLRAGLDPDNLVRKGELSVSDELDTSKAWKDIWSAGQGIGDIRDLPPVAALCDRLRDEYRRTCLSLAGGFRAA